MAENGNKDEHAWEDEAELHLMEVCPLFTAPDYWYRDLVHYLHTSICESMRLYQMVFLDT